MTSTVVSARTEPRRKQERSRRGGTSGESKWIPYLFLMPWLIGLITITLGPMVASLYLSLTSYDLIGSSSFIGFGNYRQMFSDQRFLAAAWVTARYVLISVPIQLSFALGLAALLNRGIRGLAFYRSVYYLPSLLGASVAVAVLWRQVFGSDGLVNQVLGVFGLTDLPSWVATPSTALGTIIALNVWTFGAPMIIFLAGLRQIPTELYEAASMDGAGTWHRFLKITLPLLSPVIFFNLVLQMIHAFQAFTQAYVVSNGTGGPVDSTLFYSMYLYQQGFTSFKMGYASAMAWVLLVVIALFSAIAFGSSRFWVYYGED